jgi:hypothetical protein
VFAAFSFVPAAGNVLYYLHANPMHSLADRYATQYLKLVQH